MISTSTTQVVPFTPPWLTGENAPVYRLRAGGVIERGQMEAELAGPLRARQVLGYELRLAMTEGVQALLADDPELDRTLGVIAAANEAELGEGEPLSADDARLLEEIAAVMTEHWPAYRDLTAEMHRRRELAPIVALRRFCTGWDNVTDPACDPVPFARGPDGLVPEATLGRLSRFEMMVAGREAFALQYGGGQAGNSARPGASASAPTTSQADVSSKAGGRSKAGAGRKTPASRSRRGSGPSSTSG